MLAEEGTEEERVPSLKTLCEKHLRGRMSREFFQAVSWNTSSRIARDVCEDTQECIASQKVSIPPILFSDSWVYTLPEIRQFAALITNLDLNNLNLGELIQDQSAARPRLTALLQNTPLRTLELRDNGLRQDIFTCLQPLSGLTKLDATGNHFTNFNIEHFTNLTSLNLSWNNLKHMPRYNTYYPKADIQFQLTDLDVSGNHSICLIKEDFNYLTTLTNLNLAACNLPDLNGISALTNLRTLKLNKNRLGRNEAFCFQNEDECLEILPTLTNLTSLDLAGNTIYKK